MKLSGCIEIRFKQLVNYLAGWNSLLIFIMFSILINLFPVVNVLMTIVKEYSSNPGYYSSFLIGLLLQQFFFTVVMTFILIEVSKINVKPLYQAFVFVLSLILVKLLLSIYTYVSVGMGVSSIDFIGQVTNSMRLWLYYYALSWFCFTVVNVSSQIKKE